MGRGYLRFVPEPLRPIVRPPLDALRRFLTRMRWLFGVRLHPRRMAATRRFLRDAEARHRSGAVAAEPARVPIAVDADALWDQMTGIGWYLHRILDELKDADGIELRLYGPPSYGDERPPAVPLPEGPAIHLVSCPVPDDQSLPTGLAHWVLRRRESRMIASSGCRAVWLPNFIPPPRFERLKAPRVVTVHDLAALLYPWTLRESRRKELERQLVHEIGSAEHVLTPSERVRTEIVERELKGERNVTAVLHGPGHLHVDESPGEAALLESCGLEPNGFVVHVGTLEPRKNIAFLVALWRRWFETDPDGCLPLVLCGGDGWKIEGLREEIERGCAGGWLVRPGYLDDTTLGQVYAAARFSISASIYEGFGLPLVESMAAGTAVLCSDIPVYREVTDGAARLVPITDREGIQGDDLERWLDTVREMAADEGLLRGLEAEGRDRIERLSWEDAAASICGCLLRVAGDAAPVGAGSHT